MFFSKQMKNCYQTNIPPFISALKLYIVIYDTFNRQKFAVEMFMKEKHTDSPLCHNFSLLSSYFHHSIDPTSYHIPSPQLHSQFPSPLALLPPFLPQNQIQKMSKKVLFSVFTAIVLGIAAVSAEDPIPTEPCDGTGAQEIDVENIQSSSSTVVIVNDEGQSVQGNELGVQGNEAVDRVKALIEQIRTLLGIPDGEVIRAGVEEELLRLQGLLVDELNNLKEMFPLNILISLLPPELVTALEDIQTRLEEILPDILELPGLDEILGDLLGGLTGLGGA